MTKTRFIPAQSIKVADKNSDAIAYVYTSPKGSPCAVVYYGKQSKPVAHSRFASAESRAKYVKQAFEGRQAHFAAKAEYKAKRLAPNELKVGDILNTCWGYEQTNREFFQVTEVSGQYVTLCEIAQATDYDSFHMTGRCAPQAGKFIGKPMRKLVQYGVKVTIDDCRTAWKWNTATVAGVAIGPALSYSDGH